MIIFCSKRFIKFFTEIEVDETEDIFKKEKNINNLKILLANEATKILHGESKAKKAERTAKQTFETGGVGVGLPEINIKLSELRKGIGILDILSKHGVLPSKSEARRAIANNGIKIHNSVVTDEKNHTVPKTNAIKTKISNLLSLVKNAIPVIDNIEIKETTPIQLLPKISS